MFYKGEFFIEEPQTKFMRAIAGLLMTKAEKKYTLVKKMNGENFHRRSADKVDVGCRGSLNGQGRGNITSVRYLTGGNFSSRSSRQGLGGLP